MRLTPRGGGDQGGDAFALTEQLADIERSALAYRLAADTKHWAGN